MFHSQLSNYFGFLGLDGYEKCHLYHFYCENINYQDLNDYYLHHFNKIIMDKPFKNPAVIPANWYQYSRTDVSSTTRKSSIQAGFEKWVAWEKETKTLYQSIYQELVKLNEIGAAEKIAEYVRDVDDELAAANQKYLELMANDFDMSDIIMEQAKDKKKYQERLKELELC